MKFDYETSEIKIRKLRKQMDELNKKHSGESAILKLNAVSWSLSEIQRQKQSIQKIVDQKKAIQKDIDALQPPLFEVE